MKKWIGMALVMLLGVGQVFGEDSAEAARGYGLCSIQLTGGESVALDLLAPNVKRLSGSYQPRITSVPEAIVGKAFTRVPWRSTPTYRIKVTQSGYLYALQMYQETRTRSDLEWEKVREESKGAHMTRGVYRAWVKKGQEVELSGYELSLVATKIVRRDVAVGVRD